MGLVEELANYFFDIILKLTINFKSQLLVKNC